MKMKMIFERSAFETPRNGEREQYGEGRGVFCFDGNGRHEGVVRIILTAVVVAGSSQLSEKHWTQTLMQGAVT